MNIEAIPSSLFDLFLKSTVLLTLALMMTTAFRRMSAANRHAIAAAVFIALLLLPCTKLLSPQWSFDWSQGPSLSEAEVHIALLDGLEISHPAMLPEEAVFPMVEPWLDTLWPTTGVVAWLGGGVLLLARRFWISLRLGAVVYRSRTLEAGRLAEVVRKIVEAGGVKAEVRVSHECRVPLVSGILHPRVLLPVEAEEWPEALITATLQHELGHIRRRDCITRLMANIVCAIYWLNPLVWFAARKLRLLQEHACDDLVLNAGASAEGYASQLVVVVRNLQGNRFISRHAMAMAQPSTLETRIRAIVDETLDRSPRAQRGAFAGGVFTSFVLVLCTTAQLCGAVEKYPEPFDDKLTEARQQDIPVPSNGLKPEKAQSAVDKVTAAPLHVSIESRFVEITGDAAHPMEFPAGLELFKVTPTVIGVLNDKQFQTIIKQLTQRKGVDLLSAPRLITRSNQAATVEVAREFAYPPPNAKDRERDGVKPEKPEVKKVGVSLAVRATVQSDDTMDLRLKPEVVEFEGFTQGKSNERQPIFNTRNLNAEVSIRPGQTVAMGLGSRMDTQLIEDRVLFFFKKRTRENINRHLLVFVTAKMINPGVPEKP